MSYTKQQLIEILTPALAKTTKSASQSVRNTLETYDLAGLEKELARQRKAGLVSPQAVEDPEHDPEIIRRVEAIRAEVRRNYENDPERIRRQEEEARQAESVYRDYYFAQIFRTVIDGRIAVDNMANRNIILGWLNLDEALNHDWFVKVLRGNPTLASSLQWQSADILDPEKRKQAEARQQELDKQTFEEAARTLRSFGVNEANLNVTRQTLGPGFSQYAIQQALVSNALQLSPPSQEELGHWATEDIEANNESLLKADPIELRARVRQDSADKRAQQEQQQANDSFEAAKQRDAALGFPSLPTDITKEQIRNLPTERLKVIIKRYGSANVTARLQGRD